MALLVGGGQAYYGETAERDKLVVIAAARHLYELVGDNVEIITGGMPGIPHDFAMEWKRLGGTDITFVISEEVRDTLKEVEPGVMYAVMGKDQKERRIALTKIERIRVALFIQGGQYTTDEIIKCQERGDIDVICFSGSGGAAGGQIPYNGQLPAQNKNDDDLWMHDCNPRSDHNALGMAFASAIADRLQ